MGGIVAWVARAPRDVTLDGALKLLCHRDNYRRCSYVDTPVLKVGSAYRASAPPEVDGISEDDVTVVLYGAPLLKFNGWCRPSVRHVAERFRDRGRESLFELDGTFLAVVVDRRAGTLLVVNDRIGSISLTHAQTPDEVAFAPEAKSLFSLLMVRPRLDAESVVSFLNLGYPVGDRTMFESVRLLEPASVLAVDLRTARSTVERYWDLKFSPSHRVAARDAANELAEIMVEATRASLIDSPQRVQLMLTGGFDSRVLLATMCGVGRPPDESLTWGIRDDIPESDPVIAQSVSERFGVPHAFRCYGADTFVENAAAWTAISELSSDNGGNFTAGADFLYADGPPGDVVMIGDQMFGPGGLPGTLAEAEQSITKLPLSRMSPGVEQLVKPNVCGGLRERLRRSLARLVEQSGSDIPKDVQDYLFLQLYVFRWLCAAAYFREPMVHVRRPFLLGTVLGFVAGLPHKLRVDKVVLQEFLRQSMPQLASVPKASAHSLVDWNYELRVPGPLREFVRNLVDPESVEATPLVDIIERDQLGCFVSEFFSQEPKPVLRRPTLVPRVFSLRRFVSGNGMIGWAARRAEPMVRRLAGAQPPPENHKLLLRLAMLVLLQRAIDQNFAHDHS